VDAGPVPGTISRDVAAIWGASFARIDGTIDRSLSRDAIDKELAALEASARKRGFAIGAMSALPVTVDRLATWADELESRGIDLVPVSSLVTGGGQAVAALPAVSAAATTKPKARATSKPKLQSKTTTTARGTRSKVKPKPVAAKPNPRKRPASTTLQPAPAEPPATPTSAPHP
jgi:hypothetical protein